MSKKIFIFLAFLLGAFGINAQQNFTFTPEKPKPGEPIKITYEPAGDLANTMGKVEASVFLSGSKGRKADDLILTRAGKKYTATILTDTSTNFIQLGFFADKTYDNNYNEGYFIHLFDGEKERKGSYLSKTYFHQFYSEETKVDRNNEKALAAIEKEISLYPEQKKQVGSIYYRLLGTVKKKEEVTGILQKEIEATLKAGLKNEADYSYLEMLYSNAKSPEQSKLIASLKKEKFPQGKWVIQDQVNKFYQETDVNKKAQMLAELENKIKTDKDWKNFEGSLPYFKSSVMDLYGKNKQWDEFKKMASTITDKGSVASAYNNLAWGLQGKNEELKMAEELAKFATEYTRSEWKKPTTPKPDYVTTSRWEKNRENTYAMYADTYAMVLYRTGDYKKAFELTKEAALTINKGNDPDQNKTYALIAEKVLPAKELKPQLEKFVKDGKASEGAKDALKKIYIDEKKSEAGFEDYITALGRENYLKMVEELKKTMISDASPSFALMDLDGNKVNVSDLKGKVVVLDFWATWCGPCKASFPGMQKLVTKFKENPNVKFVFVDTWERGDGKEKNAADFIAKNKYTFHVLMDNDNAVVEQFKVEGIPTKFVLDKEGRIRFKSVGFDGSDDKLINELSAMIEMAGAEKTF